MAVDSTNREKRKDKIGEDRRKGEPVGFLNKTEEREANGAFIRGTELRYANQDNRPQKSRGCNNGDRGMDERGYPEKNNGKDDVEYEDFASPCLVEQSRERNLHLACLYLSIIDSNRVSRGSALYVGEAPVRISALFGFPLWASNRAFIIFFL